MPWRATMGILVERSDLLTGAHVQELTDQTLPKWWRALSSLRFQIRLDDFHVRDAQVLVD